MKITLNRPELLSLARDADSVAPSASSMDVMKCTLLEASDGKLTVSATNLQVFLVRRMKADVQEPGRVAINAQLLVGMLSLLDSEMVSLSGEDGQGLHITGGAAEYDVRTLPTADFPPVEIPFPEDTVLVTGVPAMAKRTVFAASDNDMQPLLKCVNLVFTNDGLKAVGCDGNHLAVAKGSSKGEASVSMLIPASSLTKLSRLVGNKDELRVGTTGKYVVFMKEDFLFSARLMDGKYIDADRFFESVSGSFTILSDAAVLRDMVLFATTVAGKKTYFSLLFDGGKITARCESELGLSTHSADVVPLSGTPSGEYWYVHTQLAECLKALSGTLMLEVGENGILVMKTDDLACMQMAIRKPRYASENMESETKKKGRAAKAA